MELKRNNNSLVFFLSLRVSLEFLVRRDLQFQRATWVQRGSRGLVGTEVARVSQEWTEAQDHLEVQDHW